MLNPAMARMMKKPQGSMLCGNDPPPGMPDKYAASGMSTAEVVAANGNNTTVKGVAATVSPGKSPSSPVSMFTYIMP